METRGVVAEYSAFDDQLTIWMGSQNPHFIRLFVAGALGMPETNIINNEEDLHQEENRRRAVEGEGNRGVSKEAMQMRELVGRAYLLDLAVLGRTDAVVCAVSSAACRVLAVMMGYDKAIQKGLWNNVDGGYPWQGLVVDEDG